MTHYEVTKKYKKIVTVVKIHKDVPSVLMIDDKRYVLDPPRTPRKGGKDGSRK
ncbi:hypothetical protein [Paenibacillus sp. NPDC101420]|uniref:hypothetical protein n=1 Tax=Paenibacillus sp. NPDC101420 TaxID=3390602 RepID=UPI003D06E38F